MDKQNNIILKTTTSKCAVCGKLVDNAVVFVSDDKVFLERICPEHGEQIYRISSDARLYHEAVGPNLGDCCGGSCGSKTVPAHEEGIAGYMGDNATGAASPEILASCVTLIEITRGCNMKCPTCFADALDTPQEGHMPFSEFVDKIEAIIKRKGELEILQLSGGEPTVHSEFIKILEWATAHPKILCVLVNTNGIKIATDSALRINMQSIQEKNRKIHIYLQFDGVQEEGQKILRSGDFRNVRVKALDLLREMKIPATLAMTVNHSNLPFLWQTIEFGLGREEVHGVSFQPEFFSGRTTAVVGSLPDPINVADVVTALCDQSKILTFDDLTPTPCGHPMCQWIGWLGRHEGQILTATNMGIDLPALQFKIRNRIRYDVNDLIKCQCDESELGQLIHQMEGLVQKTKVFRIFIKPFMDARMWDEDRIARCCTHVVKPDGSLDSFCRYYASGGESGSGVVQKRKVNLASV